MRKGKKENEALCRSLWATRMAPQTLVLPPHLHASPLCHRRSGYSMPLHYTTVEASHWGNPLGLAGWWQQGVSPTLEGVVGRFEWKDTTRKQ
jgi:hypothetical protein